MQFNSTYFSWVHEHAYWYYSKAGYQCGAILVGSWVTGRWSERTLVSPYASAVVICSKNRVPEPGSKINYPVPNPGTRVIATGYPVPKTGIAANHYSAADLSDQWHVPGCRTITWISWTGACIRERVHLRNTHTRWSIVYAPRMKVIQTWVFRRCTLPCIRCESAKTSNV